MCLMCFLEKLQEERCFAVIVVIKLIETDIDPSSSFWIIIVSHILHIV